jgi:2'-5' RNA ligase
MRTFLAIPVPLVDLQGEYSDSLQRDCLQDILDEFYEMGTAVRPVGYNGVHLTLKFFGDLTVEQIRAASEVVASVATVVPEFDFHLRGLGAFPSERRPSVVWVGVADGDACASLVETLEATLGEAGFPLETRPFQPHVTLARVKARPPECLAGLLSRFADTDFGCFPVSSIELIASELTPNGPIYTTLEEFKLGGDAEQSS